MGEAEAVSIFPSRKTSWIHRPWTWYLYAFELDIIERARGAEWEVMRLSVLSEEMTSNVRGFRSIWSASPVDSHHAPF